MEKPSSFTWHLFRKTHEVVYVILIVFPLEGRALFPALEVKCNVSIKALIKYINIRYHKFLVILLILIIKNNVINIQKEDKYYRVYKTVIYLSNCLLIFYSIGFIDMKI